MEIEHDKPKAQRLKEEGNVYFKQQNYTKALEFYQKAIANDPEEITYYQNRAACFLNMKRYRKCIEECENILKKDSNSHKAHRFLAQCYLLTGELQKAKLSAQKSREIQQNDNLIINLSNTITMVLSSYEQYQNFYNSNQFEEALKKIDFIRDKCPDCSLYVTQHVELLLKTGKIDKARKEMQDGHIEDPYLKSLLEFYDQKSDLAKRIISQNSSSGDQKLFHLKQIIVKSEELKQKGNDALKAKKYEEAIKYYEAAVALDAGNHIYNSIIYSNLGLVYMKQNNLNKALVNMNKSIENNKNYFKAYLRRGEIYSQQKNYDAAIKDYNKVKEIDPSQDTTSFINAALEKQKKKEKKDYYALLGVDKKSTAEDIKKAYKKLALKWHPDRHRNKPEHEQEEAKNMFKDINEAFSTLSDPKKKQMYDLGGSDDMFQGGGMPGNFNPNDIFSAFFGDKSNQDNEFQSNFPGFGSMFGGGGMGGFDNMFAGMQGGGGGGRRQRGQGGFPGGMFFQNMGGQGMGGFPDMSQMFANMQQQQQKR